MAKETAEERDLRAVVALHDEIETLLVLGRPAAAIAHGLSGLHRLRRDIKRDRDLRHAVQLDLIQPTIDRALYEAIATFDAAEDARILPPAPPPSITPLLKELIR